MKNVFVMPFVKFIEVIFLWLYKIMKNFGFTLLFLSLIINIILLPLYFFAEKIEKKEKDIQKKIKPKIDEFKSVYKGYELHLYIKNVYRLNNYRLIYSLRGLVSLLIQVPFFIGAFVYLSSYTGFEGVMLLGIPNLAKPDGLLTLGNISINVLPFLMTLFNLMSGYIYTKNSSTSEKVNIVIIGMIFLILLYNSPASLLIYWTFNNIFSLLKNLIQLKFSNKSIYKGEK